MNSRFPVLFWLVILFPMLVFSAGKKETRKFSGKGVISLEGKEGVTFVVKARDYSLALFDDQDLMMGFVPHGDSLVLSALELQGKSSLSFVPGSERIGYWELTEQVGVPPGGRPMSTEVGFKKENIKPYLLLAFVFIAVVLAIFRILNNYSFSYITLPVSSIGKIFVFDQFSSGVFPLIFLGVFLGFSALLGFILDLVLPGKFELGLTGGGFLVGHLPTSLSFFLLALVFVIVRFLFYNFLSYLVSSKELGNSLFSSALILGTILLIFLSILILLVGFPYFVYPLTKIVPFIFTIFAALFGIGMLLTHLNLGLGVPVSVRFFGIVAMEILPTVLIVKVLIEG